MRDFIIVYVNGERHELYGQEAFASVATFLRYHLGLTGTKVVCGEGDCGACTILVSRFINGKLSPYETINSCISFMYLLDRCHIITIEGLSSSTGLHPIQEAMVDCHGSQCGYCTPGIICSLASLTEDLSKSHQSINKQKIKNYLTGNLCRCTGYEPIIKAAMNVELKDVPPLNHLFDDDKIRAELLKNSHCAVKVRYHQQEIYLPTTFKEAIEYKSKNQQTILTSGATDLGVLSNKGKKIFHQVMSFSGIEEAYQIEYAEGILHVGPRVTLSKIESFAKKIFPEFSRLLHIFASPQIKNKATIVGNLMNASPIGDTIPFLMTCEAEIVLLSLSGTRIVNINDFFIGGYKELDIKSNEIVSKIKLPFTEHHYKLYKTSIRKDLDISAVTFSFRYQLSGKVIKDFSMAIGGVGPIVKRFKAIEQYAIGRSFEKKLFLEISVLLENAVTPLSDLRGSQTYRYRLMKNLLLKFFDEVSRENHFGQGEASL